jgi:hypothetical protein
VIQRVEQSCEERVQEVSGQLKQQQEMVKEGLGSMKEQTSLDQNTLEHHQTELKAQLEDGLARVHSFLSDELLQDVPTGEPDMDVMLIWLFYFLHICLIH